MTDLIVTALLVLLANYLAFTAGRASAHEQWHRWMAEGWRDLGRAMADENDDRGGVTTVGVVSAITRAFGMRPMPSRAGNFYDIARKRAGAG